LDHCQELRGAVVDLLLHHTIPEERSMNWDRVEGNWKQMKGHIKEKWGKLTDDEFDTIAGKRDKLVGKIQERYGCSRDEADAQVKIFENEYDTRGDARH
jgi:uncharacterized protein YjbJ (UPF0337 family)